MEHTIKLLIVDDEKKFLEAIAKRLRKRGFDVLAVSSGLEAIEVARKEKFDPYAAIGEALTGYLGDRLNQPVTGLTYNELGGLLAEKGVPPSLIKQVEEALTFSEMGRYAPTAGEAVTAEQMIDATRRLIVRLEKVLH